MRDQSLQLLDLRRLRKPREGSQEQFLDDLRVRGSPLKQFVDPRSLGPKLVVVGRSHQQVQGLGQVGPAVPFGHGKPVGASEGVEEGGLIDVGFLELDGTGPPGSRAPPLFLVEPIAESLGNPGQVTDGIQQDLRVQGTARGAGVVESVGPVGVVDGAGQLVGMGTDDPAEQVPEVVSVAGKVFGQSPQQLRMGGRVVAAEVVHRVHDPSAEEVAPEPIDGGLGEIGVGGDPLGQLAPGKAGAAEGHPGAVQQSGRHLLSGAGVENPQLGGTGDVGGDLTAVGAVEDHRFRIGAEPEHRPEESRHPPELILGPALVGVVVALGAVQAPPHEDPNLLAHHVFGRRQDQVGEIVPGSGTVALSGDPLLGHPVVGAVAGHGVPYPLPVGLAPLGIDPHRKDGHPEQIGQAEGPVVHELGRVEQHLDQLLPLLGIGIGQKLPHSTGGRDASGEVEADPAEELGIAGARGGKDVELSELGEDLVVDEVGAGQLRIVGNPLGHHADPGLHFVTGAANQDVGLAGIESPHQALPVQFGHLLLLGFEAHPVGIVFPSAVR